MKSDSTPQILRWSTDDVPVLQRLDFYAEALTQSIDPMHVAKGSASSFSANGRSIDIGAMSIIRVVGGEHFCVRDRRDVAKSGGRNYHLILNLSSEWTLVHRGRHRLGPGDVIMLDAQLGHEITLQRFEIVHLRIPEAWLKCWLQDPSILTGRILSRDSQWGIALRSFMAQLSPEFIIRAPIPVSVISDHIGALLALIADHHLQTHKGPERPQRDRARQIFDCIAQRCNESQLTATDIATALAISPRTVHRTLAARGNTFGGSLINARVVLARRMLESSLFNRVTTAEIGRRAGFSAASHFSRAFRRVTGLRPSQIRAAAARLPE